MEALIFGSIALTVGLAAWYARTELRWRWRWREVVAGETPAAPPGGVYRASGTVPRYLPRAPRAVRLAALSAVALAALFLAALCLFFECLRRGNALEWPAAMASVLWLPSGITLLRLFHAGLQLVRREASDALGQSLVAGARLNILFYAVLLGSISSLLLLVSRGWDGRIAGMIALVVGWPVAALAQARWLRRVAHQFRADLL